MISKSYIKEIKNYYANSYQHFPQSFEHPIFPEFSGFFGKKRKICRNGNSNLVTKRKQEKVYIKLFLPSEQIQHAGIPVGDKIILCHHQMIRQLDVHQTQGGAQLPGNGVVLR